MRDNLQRLRARAIANTLFTPTTLPAALNRLGFVQADPIKSPATAQDLILRQRVQNYRVGDLDRRYAALDVEEDFLYAYGFLPRQNWRLLHPRDLHSMSKLEKQVLKVFENHAELHPRELEQYFGAERVVNAWGGYSKATTRVLDSLHQRGLLRICRREKGIRLYTPTQDLNQHLTPQERSRQLILLQLNIFAPAIEKNLRNMKFSKPTGCDTRAFLQELMEEGLIEREMVDGVAYIWPAQLKAAKAPPQMVRFLAPFDPLVWDRERFEKLWGWQYRFEAYTPVAKRVRGYYALPVLYGDDVIGWVNISRGDKRDKSKGLIFELGYDSKRPTGATFKTELQAEMDRFTHFLTKE